jgi:hypothetical protein
LRCTAADLPTSYRAEKYGNAGPQPWRSRLVCLVGGCIVAAEHNGQASLKNTPRPALCGRARWDRNGANDDAESPESIRPSSSSQRVTNRQLVAVKYHRIEKVDSLSREKLAICPLGHRGFGWRRRLRNREEAVLSGFGEGAESTGEGPRKLGVRARCRTMSPSLFASKDSSQIKSSSTSFVPREAGCRTKPQGS